MNIAAKPWAKNRLPKKILAIRMHAMGDVIITMPYLQNLRNSLPENTRLDFLTITESATIPRNLYLFNDVYAIGGGRNFKKQIIYAALLLPKLFFQRYEIILDLQNGIISTWLIKLLFPKAWAIFDKVSPVPAGERTRCTIEAARVCKNEASSNFRLKSDFGADELLKKNGKKSDCEIVILNPAGAFETRNWPVENYLRFAELWLEQFPKTQFILMGITQQIALKANYLQKKLGRNIIDLVYKTTPEQAFAIVQKTKLTVSEDSGLMHMAWVSGIPVLALFGSTRSDWSRPLGEHTFLFHSSNLPCGNCMLQHCKYGDTHCLTRYTPEMVFEKTASLIKL